MSEGGYALIGVALGGMLGLIGQFALEKLRQCAEAKAVAAAFAAEISGLKENAERRRFEQYYQNLLEGWRRGENVDFLPEVPGADSNLTPIGSAYVGRLGVLAPQDVSDVVLFYQRFDQINGTIVLLAQGFYSTLASRIEVVEGELENSRNNFALAENLIERLKKY
ncbi:MAG: hypothetical protein P1U69_11860 [Parvibaculaceae bacterium]|nr:hypothetical protein [Parvibaculaceae bacterium]|tara:strand:+ start:305 stop:802 length:498 start_codon:yes stop_codon:yes gene_type:complete